MSGTYYPERCPECMRAVTPNLIGACASVGIEHAESTGATLRTWLRRYHERGHVELTDREPREG